MNPFPFTECWSLPFRIFSSCLEFSPGATNYVDTSLNERSLVSGGLYLYLELLYSTLIYNFSFSKSFGWEGDGRGRSQFTSWPYFTSLTSSQYSRDNLSQSCILLPAHLIEC